MEPKAGNNETWITKGVSILRESSLLHHTWDPDTIRGVRDGKNGLAPPTSMLRFLYLDAGLKMIGFVILCVSTLPTMQV